MAVPSRPMAAARLSSALPALLLLSACGGSSGPPTPGTPGGGGGETITGRERLGWSQPAQDSAQLATLDYAIYVDGVRTVLNGDTCSGNASPFECSAPLPPLSPGGHSLELASFIVSDGSVVESERSAALRVTVAGATAPADLDLPQHAPLTTPDGYTVSASVVGRGLDDPTDLALAPDGRAFVSERSGRVKIVGGDGAVHTALDLADHAAGNGRLTSIALHPAFDRTNLVFAAHLDDHGLRIFRFRERDGVLAEGATVMRERSTADHTVIRFGPDGLLYAAVAAVADPREAQRDASPLGKILRLREDGTLPRDNPRASAVWSSGHRDPRGLAWHPGTGKLWEVERGGDAGDEINAIAAGADYGWPVAMREGTRGGSARPTLLMPPGTDVASADFVPTGRSSSPFAGELLVASAAGEDVFRLSADEKRSGLIGGLLQGRYGRIAVVRAAADGTILLATGNRETWGAGRDVVLRLAATGP